MVIKKLEEVESFNEQLLNDRSRILQKQQEEYVRLLKETEHKVKELETEENEKLQYLNSHGALDDYTKLTEFLSDLKSKKEKLEQYKRLQKDYKTRREEIKREFTDENLKTQRYLDHIDNLVHRHMEFFHDLAKTFYSDKRAGLHDPRQIATMFRNANAICQAHGFQYILTINECSLDLLNLVINFKKSHIFVDFYNL